MFLLFSCCFLLLTLLFYSLDIRRGENNRFHTHTFIFVIVAYCVLVFVLFRFLCSIGSLSLCCVFVCVLFHIRFAFKRFNNSTKGDFQKYLCRKIELVVLCVILCLLFSSFFLNHFVTVLFLSFMSPCVIFNALYSLALFFSSFVDLLVIFCTVALLCCELLALIFCRHLFSRYQTHVFLLRDAFSVLLLEFSLNLLLRECLCDLLQKRL